MIHEGRRMNSSGENQSEAFRIGLPEMLLCVAVFLVSPLALLAVNGGFILLPGASMLVSIVGMFLCSMAYLHLTSLPKGQGLIESIMKKDLGRSGTAYVAYIVVLLLYWAPLAVTIGTRSFAPFALFFAFVPFHSAGVLAVTVASRRTTADRRVSRTRLSLAVLLLLCALLWPFVLVSGFGLT